MRLICPNCTAQYDVPDNAIPTQGRDLHCAACAHDWFFTPPPARATVKMPPPLAAQPITKTVAEPAVKPATAARPAIAPAVAAILQAEAARSSLPTPPAAHSTATDPAPSPARSPTNPPMPPEQNKTGFWRGFAIIGTAFALLAALYFVADDLSLAWPQLAPSMTSYSSLIDQMRLGLVQGAEQLAARFAS